MKTLGAGLLLAASHTTTPGLYRKLPFDPVKDFAGIAQLVTVPYLLVVHPSLPANSVKDFIALAETKPGELTYGSAGMVIREAKVPMAD